jgi:hypothetical protein
MSLALSEGDLTPGTLFYWRSWVNEQGPTLRVATFRAVDGQVWWLPDPNHAPKVTPRSFCVLVDGLPASVRSVEEVVRTKPPTMVLEVTPPPGETASGATSLRPSRKVLVSVTHLVQRLADGWEMVDGRFENT